MELPPCLYCLKAPCFPRGKHRTLENGSARSDPHTPPPASSSTGSHGSSLRTHLSPHRNALSSAQNGFHFSLTLFNFFSSLAHNLTTPSWGKPSLRAFMQALKHHAPPLFCSTWHSSVFKLPCGIISFIVMHLPPFRCMSQESRTVSVLTPEAQYLVVKWVNKWLNQWVRCLSIYTVTAIIN